MMLVLRELDVLTLSKRRNHPSSTLLAESGSRLPVIFRALSRNGHIYSG
jgi:hypothetical protein